MKLTRVSKALAILLKGLGYNIPTAYHYPKGVSWENQKNCLETDWNNFTDMASNSDYCSAPTLELAMKWFREKFNLYIVIFPDKTEGVVTYNAKICQDDPTYEWNLIKLIPENKEQLDTIVEVGSFEEAAENALLLACKLINVKSETN